MMLWHRFVFQSIFSCEISSFWHRQKDRGLVLMNNFFKAFFPAPVLSSRTDIPRQRGFIVLISAIVISFVLLISVVAVAQKGVTGRYLLLTLENKSISAAAAEGCIEIARVKIASNASYTVLSSAPVTLPVGSGSCTITSVTISGSNSIVSTTASSTGATTNLVATVHSATGDIVSWSEVAVLP